MPARSARPRRTARPANARGEGDNGNNNGADTNGTAAAPELVVVTKAEAGLRARRGRADGIASTSGADVTPLSEILEEGITLTPLFGVSEERLMARASMVAAESGVTVPDLSVFYKVEAPAGQLEEYAERLRELDIVEAAYVKPPAEPPQINDMVASPEEAPPATPDFTASQLYLAAAPAGVEALWAHTRPGGKGNNIRIIDIEGAWRFSHEDLTQVQGGVVGGVQINNLVWRDHGTAVIGVFGGDENTLGVKGISPNANTRAISIFLNAAGTAANSSKAIKDAADLLSAGDIILLELHRPGPRHNFQSRQDQRGYIAIEWWEDDFQAIKYATSKGIIVVEAAGNGAENLDDAIYNVRPAGFPATWTNPFKRANRDSGAILVGAGAPPPGTHGRDHGPDRSRLDFSNYGASLDAQGWGREVTTAGYGDLQGGSNEDLWYTERFSGTSSASPVVVGAIACVQGNRKARSQPVLTPAQVRNKLRTTGSPQQDAPGRPATQRIGNRPNLRQLIGGIKKIEIKEIKEGKEIIKEKDFKVEKVEIKEVKLEKIEKIEVKEFDFSGQAMGGQGFESEAMLEQSMTGFEQMPDMEVAAPLPSRCTAFGGMPVGVGPNPRNGTQASFLVRQFNGVPAPNTQVLIWGGLKGLNCRFRCDVTLASAAQSVTLALAHFSQPATVRAFNGNGALVGSATMTPQQGAVQSLVINGLNIKRVVISCPANETLLLRFCYRPMLPKPKIEKIEKIEKAEFKEIKDAKDTHKELEGGPNAGGGASVEERLTNLEAQLNHFISTSLRPDLSSGALTEEQGQGFDDPAALSQSLAKDAADAKQAKDNKDIEKLSEQ